MVLICIALIISAIEHLFMSVGHLCYFFGKISAQAHCTFSYWVVCLLVIELSEFFTYFVY